MVVWLSFSSIYWAVIYMPVIGSAVQIEGEGVR